MKFDFLDRRAVYEQHIVFALCLDKKKMKERVIIGKESEVQKLLENGSGDVYFDETAPLGNMISTFESDTENQWEIAITQLADSYDKLLTRWKWTELPFDFLRRKYENGALVAKYAAIRIWVEYINCYNMNHGKKELEDRTTMLCRTFHLYANNELLSEKAYNIFDNVINSNESRLDLWYPTPKRSIECVVAYYSFKSMLFYYLNRIKEWNLYFQQCKVCGRAFLAGSRRYELCSESCRTKQAAENKRQFDERTKDSHNEKLYGITYDYWYNRIRKLKQENASESIIAEATEAFEKYRLEGVRLKGELEADDFKIWIDGQMAIIDSLVNSPH